MKQDLRKPFLVTLASFGMKPRMFGLSHHLKILMCAVSRVAINMVDYFSLDKSAPDFVFGGNGVIKHLASSGNEYPLTTLRNSKFFNNRTGRISMSGAAGTGHIQSLTIRFRNAFKVIANSAPWYPEFDKPIPYGVPVNAYSIRDRLARAFKINVFIGKPVG